MQVFEVHEIDQYPYMETKEVLEGLYIKDVIMEKGKEKVFLLVDHVIKRIWIWNGPESSIKLQVYGALLANRLRNQLKLFYRVYFLNTLSKKDPKFLEIINAKIGKGKARDIKKEDFGDLNQLRMNPSYITIFKSLNKHKIIEQLQELPIPDNMVRKFIIMGGDIHAEEEIIKNFVKEEKIIKKPEKLGRINNGFTFFDDQNYSTRILIKNNKIEAIEFFVKKEEILPPLELEIPLSREEKFSKEGDFNFLLGAFHMPPPEFTVEEQERMELFDKIKSTKKENE
ncbi:MAG: hypothetical protein ACTSXH_10300 [Promethearchaeota archaeon]